MVQCINKASIIEEIERRIDFFTEEAKKGNCDINIAVALCGLNEFVNTLEVVKVY